MIDMDNLVLEAIRTRRSIRRYTSEQVSEELLHAVLEAGTYAATGHNSQDPLIVAVQNQEINGRLRKMNAEIMGTGGDPYYGAPTIVLVFIPKPEDNPNSIQDGSLVLGNMMLAAHSVGLASCWINRELEMFATPEGEKLKRELGVPEEYMGIGALALGHPARPNPKALPRKENYWKVIK